MQAPKRNVAAAAAWRNNGERKGAALPAVYNITVPFSVLLGLK